MWEDGSGLLAGRDLDGGGTWLGVNVLKSRVAFLTNLRSRDPVEPSTRAHTHTSRGELPTGFLNGDASPQDFAQAGCRGRVALRARCRCASRSSYSTASAVTTFRPNVVGSRKERQRMQDWRDAAARRIMAVMPRLHCASKAQLPSFPFPAPARRPPQHSTFGPTSTMASTS